MKCIDWQL